MARTFDGVDQRLEVDSAPVAATPFTMACWARTTDRTVWQHAMFLGDKDSNTMFYDLAFSGGGPNFPIEARSRGNGAGHGVAFTTTFPANNTWHHLCAVFTSVNSRSAFLDGGGKGVDGVASTLVGMDRFSIGRAGDLSPSAYLSGQVAEPGIWNVALTDAEVLELALGIRPVWAVRPESQLLYADCVRGDANQDERDLIGSLTLVGAGTTKPGIAAHPAIYYPTPFQFPGRAAAAVSRRIFVTAFGD